jgi:hypothetical protein
MCSDEKTGSSSKERNRNHVLEISALQAHGNMPATITGSKTISRVLVFSGSSHHTLTDTVRPFISHPFLSSIANVLEVQICTMKAASDKGKDGTCSQVPAQTREVENFVNGSGKLPFWEGSLS